jgi:hypothetical protein
MNNNSTYNGLTRLEEVKLEIQELVYKCDNCDYIHENTHIETNGSLSFEKNEIKYSKVGIFNHPECKTYSNMRSAFSMNDMINTDIVFLGTYRLIINLTFEATTYIIGNFERKLNTLFLDNDDKSIIIRLKSLFDELIRLTK